MAYFIIKPWYKKTSGGGIYGAEWDGSSTTVWTRTDDAVGLANPNPYYAGMSGTPSSPFDDISPWKDMVVSEDSAAGTVVSIPKFYYKLSRPDNNPSAGLKIQISMSPFDGSHVSPAHMDRGDGKGERDVVYVGRYHCASTYKSTTGVQPVGNYTRAQFRTSIHNLGSDIWQYDFAMYWTICMLYLVEYANWDSQSCIGYGCSDSGSKQNMGLTDSMTYHTGTTQSSRTTYGHTQYRYIEDLWGNVMDWCDGIYFNSANIYAIKNPSSFSDTSGGTLIGTRPTSGGYISAWNIPSVEGFEYGLYPSAVSGSEATYICDYCGYSSSGVVLFVGGSYSRNLSYGLFFLSGSNAASGKYSDVGSRLQKLP